MPRKKKTVFTVSLLLILFVSSVLLLPDHANCHEPLILSNRARADVIVAELVNQLGGLPRLEAGSTESSISQASVYPVDSWEIETFTVGNSTSLLASITDDDPVYSYSTEFLTVYTDGSEQRLRWSSWRYGLVVCPIVFISGDGPPGKLEPATLSGAS